MLVHLMLELYGCDRSLLTNEELIRRVLDEYPARVDMERVSPVHLYDIETSNPLDAGLSGFVVIAQSHISLHAWPEYGEVDIDICSCKEFSQEDAIAFAKGFTSRMAQMHTQRTVPMLVDRVARGEIDPSAVVTHHMSLDDAHTAYETFKHKNDECLRVVLKP